MPAHWRRGWIVVVVWWGHVSGPWCWRAEMVGVSFVVRRDYIYILGSAIPSVTDRRTVMRCWVVRRFIKRRWRGIVGRYWIWSSAIVSRRLRVTISPRSCRLNVVWVSRRRRRRRRSAGRSHCLWTHCCRRTEDLLLLALSLGTSRRFYHSGITLLAQFHLNALLRVIVFLHNWG